jgi:hypothetical protein
MVQVTASEGEGNGLLHVNSDSLLFLINVSSLSQLNVGYKDRLKL